MMNNPTKYIIALLIFVMAGVVFVTLAPLGGCEGQQPKKEKPGGVVFHLEQEDVFENIHIDSSGDVTLIKGESESMTVWNKGLLGSAGKTELSRLLSDFRTDEYASQYLPKKSDKPQLGELQMGWDWFELRIEGEKKPFICSGKIASTPEKLRVFTKKVQALAVAAVKPQADIPAFAVRAVPLMEHLRLSRDVADMAQRETEKVAKLREDQVEITKIVKSDLSEYPALDQAISTPCALVPMDTATGLRKRLNGQTEPFIETERGFFALEFFSSERTKQAEGKTE